MLQRCEGRKSTLCRVFEHRPSHGIELVLQSVARMGMVTAMQQDDVISDFTMLALDLSKQQASITKILQEQAV